MFADLEYVCAQAGLQGNLDDLEPWQIAARLGIGVSSRVQSPTDELSERRAPSQPAASQSLIEARIRASRGEGPEPEPAAPDASLMAFMAQVEGAR